MPPLAPRPNRRLMIAGFLCLLAGFVVLLNGFGYNGYPCDPPLACIILPNPFAPVATLALLFSVLALVPAVMFTRAGRATGIVAACGALAVVFGALLVWDRSYDFGGQSIQYLQTAPIWVPFAKLGLVALGAVLDIFGCILGFSPSTTRGKTASGANRVGESSVRTPTQ
jgi:hypothetical protein